MTNQTNIPAGLLAAAPQPEPAQPSGNAGEFKTDDQMGFVLAAIQHYGSQKWAEGKGIAPADLLNVREAWDAVYAAVQSLAAQAQPPVSQPVKCGHCGGTGQTCTGTIDGTPELFDCHHCGGTGDVSGEYPGVMCPVCDGTGKAPQPAEPEDGEEIMVNAVHDVFTLPLQPSGLSSGPRFVVHVPGPEQPAAVDEAMVFRLAVWMAKHDGCEDPHRLIYEGTPPVPWGEVWNRYEYDARAALTAALATQQQEKGQ